MFDIYSSVCNIKETTGDYMTKTHHTFVQELGGRGLYPIEGYVNARTKIAFECEVCGRRWESTPNNILRGQGCPDCANVRRSVKHLKENKILSDNGFYLEVDVSTKRHPNSTMLIDKKDWDALDLNGRVYVSKPKGCKTKYARTHVGGRSVLIHRMLIDSDIVDHKNRNGLDNRRVNIRPCTSSQNGMNRNVRSDSVSGFRGVSKRCDGKKWRASIGHNGGQFHLGSFATFAEAVEARVRKEIELFGEFANVGGK